MINQKKSKHVRIDSWLLKLLSRDMKTKTKSKDKPTNNHKNLQKDKSNGKYDTYHGSLSQKWIDGRYRSFT